MADVGVSLNEKTGNTHINKRSFCNAVMLVIRKLNLMGFNINSFKVCTV